MSTEAHIARNGIEGHALRRAGVTVIVILIASKAVGFLREVVVAATYGTSSVVDVYLVAVAVPVLVSTVLYHTIPNSFIPIWSGDQELGRSARSIAAYTLVGVVLVALAIGIFAPGIAALTNSGLPGNSKGETIWILRLTSGTVLLSALEAFARTRLMIQRKFVWSGIAPIWQGLAVILAILLFPSGGARTLAWGYLVGVSLTALWNLVRIARKPTPHREAKSRTDNGDSKFHIWVIMIVFADVIAQLFGLVDRRIGSYLIEGSVAALQYANLLSNLPLSIGGFALATAIFPFVSDAIESKDNLQASGIIEWAVGWGIVGIVPVLVWLIMHSEAIVGLLLQRGAFDAQSNALTASCLVAYSFGLLPAVLMTVLVRLLHSHRDWAPILTAMILGLATKAGLAVWWVRNWDATGLAAATSVAQWGMMAVLLYTAARKYWRPPIAPWIRKIVVLLVLTFTGAFAAKGIATAIALTGRWSAIMELLASLLIGLLLIQSLGPRWGVDEVSRIRQFVGKVVTPVLGRRRS